MVDSGEEPRRTSKTQYDVAAIESTSVTSSDEIFRTKAAQPPRAKKVAIFVAHGMGQQIPFQTLDQVAEGLLRQDRKTPGSTCTSDVRAVKVQDGGSSQWLHRIELHLKGGVEAHVYEGYWAPLTEGKITARGVMSFLRDAGINGLQNGSRQFYRWLFGHYQIFASPIRIVFYLLIALATVASLVTMNSIIALVAASRTLLGTTPDWLSNGLFLDLTTTFNAVVTAMAVFGASLGLSYALKRLHAPAAARRIWGWLTVVLFVVVLFAITLAGLSLALLFYGHVKWKAGTTSTLQLWHRLFPPAAIDSFNASFDYWALHLAVGAGALFLAWWIFRLGWGVLRDLARPAGRWLTLLATICLVLLAGLAVWLGFAFLSVFHQISNGSNAGAVIRKGLAWPLLVALSAFVRLVLVQYLGDVAIYISPYKLDAFFQLRDQIKETVYKVAHAVYAQQRSDGLGPEYDEILMVGHSLGSVIVYDVLNQLVNEDQAAGNASRVVDRTPFLLTFGSPLDKTAFLFAVQRQHTDEAREALAATVQPLILDYRFRPKSWINIYSPWDIISGPLDFYDPPGSKDPSKGVKNEVDPDATTLLAAHVEYWSNDLLFRRLYDAL